MKDQDLFVQPVGYQLAYRTRFHFLRDEILTIPEFVLYEYGVGICDWDDRHANFGTFKATDEEIAHELGWSSRTTVYNHRNQLIEKEVFQVVRNDRIKPIHFEAWQPPPGIKPPTTYVFVQNNEQAVPKIEQDEANNVSIKVELSSSISTDVMTHNASSISEGLTVEEKEDIAISLDLINEDSFDSKFVGD